MLWCWSICQKMVAAGQCFEAGFDVVGDVDFVAVNLKAVEVWTKPVVVLVVVAVSALELFVRSSPSS